MPAKNEIRQIAEMGIRTRITPACTSGGRRLNIKKAARRPPKAW
jgi:hypothetical protein